MGEPADQCLVARRVAEATNHSRDLSVKDRRRNRTGQVADDLDILARRVEYFEGALIGHQGEERRQIDSRGERIDRRRFLEARNLDKTQNRPIGPLAHKLGVDCNKARPPLPCAKFGQRIRVRDNCHN